MRSYLDYDTRGVIDVCQLDEDGWWITRINVPKKSRGKGVASALLKKVLVDADSEGVLLKLHIAPSDGLSYQQLRSWYERYGFTTAKGLEPMFIRRPSS